MRPYVLPSIALALLLEGSFISLPLVFVLLAVFAVKGKQSIIFPMAFFTGLILDSFYLRPIGQTSIFFLLFLFTVFSYENKFETDTAFFVFVSTFLGSMILLLALGQSQIILKSFLTSILAIFVSKLEAKLDNKLW